MLCALHRTRLWRVQAVYKLVGHTHSHCDRAFSGVKVALLGKIYLSEPVAWLDKFGCCHTFFCDGSSMLAVHEDMAKLIMESLKSYTMSYTMRWNHLSTSLDFDGLRKILGVDCHNLRNVHDLEIFRSEGGVFCRWKQYMSDDVWSKPRLLIPPEHIGAVARAVPQPVKHAFPDGHKVKFQDFLNKLEMFMASTNMLGEKEKEGMMKWLRKNTSTDTGAEFSIANKISEIERANVLRGHLLLPCMKCLLPTVQDCSYLLMCHALSSDYVARSENVTCSKEPKSQGCLWKA